VTSSELGFKPPRCRKPYKSLQLHFGSNGNDRKSDAEIEACVLGGPNTTLYIHSDLLPVLTAIAQYEDDRVPSKKHLADETILVDRFSAFAFWCFSPHLLDILQDLVVRFSC
jgi:hypothetical protein